MDYKELAIQYLKEWDIKKDGISLWQYLINHGFNDWEADLICLEANKILIK